MAGAAGLAVSYCAAMVMTIRESPVVAVAELVIRVTPGAVVEKAIDLVGQRDKPLLVTGILVVLGIRHHELGERHQIASRAQNCALALEHQQGAIVETGQEHASRDIELAFRCVPS